MLKEKFEKAKHSLRRLRKARDSTGYSLADITRDFPSSSTPRSRNRSSLNFNNESYTSSPSLAFSDDSNDFHNYDLTRNERNIMSHTDGNHSRQQSPTLAGSNGSMSRSDLRMESILGDSVLNNSSNNNNSNSNSRSPTPSRLSPASHITADPPDDNNHNHNHHNAPEEVASTTSNSTIIQSSKMKKQDVDKFQVTLGYLLESTREQARLRALVEVLTSESKVIQTKTSNSTNEKINEVTTSNNSNSNNNNNNSNNNGNQTPRQATTSTDPISPSDEMFGSLLDSVEGYRARIVAMQQDMDSAVTQMVKWRSEAETLRRDKEILEKSYTLLQSQLNSEIAEKETLKTKLGYTLEPIIGPGVTPTPNPNPNPYQAASSRSLLPPRAPVFDGTTVTDMGMGIGFGDSTAWGMELPSSPSSQPPQLPTSPMNVNNNGNNNQHMMPISIVLDVDIGDGRYAKIPVSTLDDPFELARTFAKSNDLDIQCLDPLAGFIARTQLALRTGTEPLPIPTPATAVPPGRVAGIPSETGQGSPLSPLIRSSSNASANGSPSPTQPLNQSAQSTHSDATVLEDSSSQARSPEPENNFSPTTKNNNNMTNGNGNDDDDDDDDSKRIKSEVTSTRSRSNSEEQMLREQIDKLSSRLEEQSRSVIEIQTQSNQRELELQKKVESLTSELDGVVSTMKTASQNSQRLQEELQVERSKLGRANRLLVQATSHNGSMRQNSPYNTYNGQPRPGSIGSMSSPHQMQQLHLQHQMLKEQQLQQQQIQMQMKMQGGRSPSPSSSSSKGYVSFQDQRQLQIPPFGSHAPAAPPLSSDTAASITPFSPAGKSNDNINSISSIGSHSLPFPRETTLGVDISRTSETDTPKDQRDRGPEQGQELSPSSTALAPEDAYTNVNNDKNNNSYTSPSREGGSGKVASSPGKVVFKQAVSLFDQATDMANEGQVVDAIPLYDEALGIFERLKIPELDKVRDEVIYWKQVARRHNKRM